MSTADPSAAQAAWRHALDLLARREHSSRELKMKLQRRKHDGAAVDAAIARAQEYGYQSDLRYAQMVARTRVSQGYGPRRIVAELRSHAVASDHVHSALEELDCDWTEIARRALARRHGDAITADEDPDEVRRVRARRAVFLLRRGFDGATVSTLVRIDSGDLDEPFD